MEKVYYIDFEIVKVSEGFKVKKLFQNQFSVPVRIEVVGTYKSYRAAFNKAFKLQTPLVQDGIRSTIASFKCQDEVEKFDAENKRKKIKYIIKMA